MKEDRAGGIPPATRVANESVFDGSSSLIPRTRWDGDPPDNQSPFPPYEDGQVQASVAAAAAAADRETKSVWPIDC